MQHILSIGYLYMSVSELYNIWVIFAPIAMTYGGIFWCVINFTIILTRFLQDAMSFENL